MDIIISIVKVFGVVILASWFLIFMVWPINDKQEQAPAWVLCRAIKKIMALIKNTLKLNR